jgi:hypothetical protein
MSSWYRETRHGGGTAASTTSQDIGGITGSQPAALPRTHAELDEVAAERGHLWSAAGLTVAEKQAELEA